MIKASQGNDSLSFSGNWVILTANKNKMIDLIMNIFILLFISMYILYRVTYKK